MTQPHHAQGEEPISPRDNDDDLILDCEFNKQVGMAFAPTSRSRAPHERHHARGRGHSHPQTPHHRSSVP